MALLHRPPTLRIILTVRSASTATVPLHKLLREYGNKVKAAGQRTILEVELHKFHKQREDQTLLKERAEKLEYHKDGEHEFMKKKGTRELLRRQSSIPIDGDELDKKMWDLLTNKLK